MRGLGLAVLMSLGSGCLGAKAGYALYELEATYSAAEQENAADLATYEYTLATAYRAKAWEEAGYSQYEAAEQLVARAAEFANQAAKLAAEEAEALRLLEEMQQDEDLVPEQLPVDPDAIDLEDEEPLREEILLERQKEKSAPAWEAEETEEPLLDEWVE